MNHPRMIERDSMRANGEQLESVRTRVAQGEYRIDSRQVAEAMLDRIGALEVGRMAVTEDEGGRVPRRALTGLQIA